MVVYVGLLFKQANGAALADGRLLLLCPSLQECLKLGQSTDALERKPWLPFYLK